MPDQHTASALMRAILRENCPSEAIAAAHLAQAERDGVDPLDYCSHRFGLGNIVVWRRAAQWADIAFAEMTPCRGRLPRIDRIDHLGQTRSLRQTVLGQELQFVAPRFAHVLSLAEAGDATRAKVRFVPPEAIEAGLIAGANDQLILGAQQNTTILWPRASAAQDLPLGARLGFAVLLFLLVGIVMTAGIVSRPVLVPLAAILLLAPGLMRLMAAFPRSLKATPRLLSDSELPVYSVLIPLRDEAAMVPMLARAMGALDYPALGSKLK